MELHNYESGRKAEEHGIRKKKKLSNLYLKKDVLEICIQILQVSCLLWDSISYILDRKILSTTFPKNNLFNFMRSVGSS